MNHPQYQKPLAGLLTTMLLVVGFLHWQIPSTSAVDVSSSVYVTVCGDGVPEGAEECDDGKHCSNGVACTDDLECAGIGDNLCSTRSGDGCSDACALESGGGAAPQPVSIGDVRAYPEQRFGAAGTNYDSEFSLNVLNATTHQVLYAHPSLITGNSSGLTSVNTQLTSFSSGTYDVAIKTNAHLTRIQDDVFLGIGNNVINFTHSSNLPQVGSVRLIAGDIDGLGTSPTTLGDDVINAVDLSILLQRFGDTDSTGNGVRANLNQDNVVDQEDLNILLTNLDAEGEQ